MIKKIPTGMTIHDAMQEYQDNKIVITGNDGELTIEGFECEEGSNCEGCCSRCFFKNEGDRCTW